MSLFMLSKSVDPSEVDSCSERAKKAEKGGSNAKSKVTKLKDIIASMNREFKTLQAKFKILKGKVK
jgi:hypothetical protein